MDNEAGGKRRLIRKKHTDYRTFSGGTHLHPAGIPGTAGVGRPCGLFDTGFIQKTIRVLCFDAVS
jgi:hypothetical protein